MTELRVRIECGKTTCDKCAYMDKGSYPGGRAICLLFWEAPHNYMLLDWGAGNVGPQRCAACKNAEVRDDARRHLDQ